MTKFQDGPAKGQTLMLQRTPFFLRVTEAGGKFDALNQLTDTARPEEKLYCYRMDAHLGNAHVRMTKGGGFYWMVEYRMQPEQPHDATLRDNAAWAAWCESQPEAAMGNLLNQIDRSA